jgi:hypothetical protein
LNTSVTKFWCRRLPERIHAISGSWAAALVFRVGYWCM